MSVDVRAGDLRRLVAGAARVRARGAGRAEDEGPYGDDWDAAVDRVYHHGSIVLGTDGCAMNWHLVVTGPHQGHIWHITDVDAMPFGAEFGHTTSAPGFGGWVAHWAAGEEWFDAESAEW
ncbi:hypothetical protein ACF090_16375 [Streptomyces sp. NPDC014892]|uniref:hypothetical protein n=1 Tax=Streptomyces sp. NPDC014892 TaxID=3364930 RepID=UPI0036F76D68